MMNKLVENISCSECQKTEMRVLSQNKQGFARNLLLKCDSCNHVNGQADSSPRVSDEGTQRGSFLINIKMVSAFISIGGGYSSVEKFCLETGMSVLSSSAFFKHLDKIKESSEKMKEEILVQAHKVVRKVQGAGKTDLVDIGVSFDGSWQKRGHVSLNGMAFVIDIETGLVLDFVVLSKYCHTCTLKASQSDTQSAEYHTWLAEHKDSGGCQVKISKQSLLILPHLFKCIQFDNILFTVIDKL